MGCVFAYPGACLKAAIEIVWFMNYTITVVIPVPIGATALGGFDIMVHEIATSCDSWFWGWLSFLWA